MRKPPQIFDRDHEWSELTRFVSYAGAEPALGIVSGRRRQGKTFLLDAVCAAGRGFYFAATEATEAESLHRLGVELARFLGEPVPRRFTGWIEAIDTLMRLATPGQPIPVIIDEFPYLVKASPELPSVIQRAFDPARRRQATPIRLLLCGSAQSFMNKLLVGSAPLRGRASLELIVPTLDFRLAREFWEITDPRLALLVHSVVGGTPAYRREFTLGDAPADVDDFDSWVVRNVLNPARPLFREARFLFAEEPSLRDSALYHGVLAAIADGKNTRGGIATFMGRKSTDLGHPLTVLEDVGMIVREPDAFHARRSTYRIAEPLLAFYHAIMRPEWTDLERPGLAADVWSRSRTAFHTHVLGPHIEQLARTWCRWFASAETLGGRRTRIAAGILPDPAKKTSHEIDIVVFGRHSDGTEQILAIGEVKANTSLGPAHLHRLETLRDLLQSRDPRAASPPKLLLCSGTDFTPEIHRVTETRPDLELIDTSRLYYGE